MWPKLSSPVLPTQPRKCWEDGEGNHAFGTDFPSGKTFARRGGCKWMKIGRILWALRTHQVGVGDDSRPGVGPPSVESSSSFLWYAANVAVLRRPLFGGNIIYPHPRSQPNYSLTCVSRLAKDTQGAVRFTRPFNGYLSCCCCLGACVCRAQPELPQHKPHWHGYVEVECFRQAHFHTSRDAAYANDRSKHTSTASPVRRSAWRWYRFTLPTFHQQPVIIIFPFQHGNGIGVWESETIEERKKARKVKLPSKCSWLLQNLPFRCRVAVVVDWILKDNRHQQQHHQPIVAGMVLWAPCG